MPVGREVVPTVARFSLDRGLQNPSGRPGWLVRSRRLIEDNPEPLAIPNHQAPVRPWGLQASIDFDQTALDAGLAQLAQGPLHHLAAVFAAAAQLAGHLGQGAPFVATIKAKAQHHH